MQAMDVVTAISFNVRLYPRPKRQSLNVGPFSPPSPITSGS